MQVLFNNYKVHFRAGTDYRSGQEGLAQIKVSIACYQDANLVAAINFYVNEFTLPWNEVTPQGKINLSFHLSQFNDIISTLRYEKPLLIDIDPAYRFCYLSTGQLEPIGEQEGVSYSTPKF